MKLDLSSDPTIDSTAAVLDICRQAGIIKPNHVRSIELWPRKVKITLYKLDDDGRHYLGEDGEAAVSVLEFGAVFVSPQIAVESSG